MVELIADFPEKPEVADEPKSDSDGEISVCDGMIDGPDGQHWLWRLSCKSLRLTRQTNQIFNMC